MITVGALSWHRHSLQGNQPPYAGQDVPCGTCTACCTGLKTPLTPGADDPAQYALDESDRHLARQANGDCAYLIDQHCAIYATRPLVCRTFDCRALLVTDVREPARLWEAASARFAIAAKEPGDRDFLASVRARAADVLAHGAPPAVAIQAALDGRPIAYQS